MLVRILAGCVALGVLSAAGSRAELPQAAKHENYTESIAGTKIQIEPTMIGLALKALPVLILGGLTSIPGALVGGCIIGVSELLFETYWGQPLLGGATTEWFAFMLALVFLLFRPQGLFGEPIIERV